MYLREFHIGLCPFKMSLYYLYNCLSLGISGCDDFRLNFTTTIFSSFKLPLLLIPANFPVLAQQTFRLEGLIIKISWTCSLCRIKLLIKFSLPTCSVHKTLLFKVHNPIFQNVVFCFNWRIITPQICAFKIWVQTVKLFGWTKQFYLVQLPIYRAIHSTRPQARGR